MDELDAAAFSAMAKQALDRFAAQQASEADWVAFSELLDYVPLAAGGNALRAAVEKAEEILGRESWRLHYLSVPPSAALPVVQRLGGAGLVERSRIILEKPFGTDLTSAVELN